MIDESEERGRENQHEHCVKGKLRVDDSDYGRLITNIAVAQICQSVGFQSFHGSSVEILSEIVIQYIGDLGKTAHFYANLAGRTDCNAVDVIQGLEDLVSGKPFSGALDVNTWITGSNTVREINKYVSLEEVPFARDVTRFPVINNQKSTPSFIQIGETIDRKHIPDWLPAFPDLHTYLHTPIWKERSSDPRKDKMEQARQQRKAERSLFSLQQRLACNGSSSSAYMKTGDNQFLAQPLQLGDVGNVKQAAEGKQFLAQPLQLGGKEISRVVPPTKLSNKPLVSNLSSVLEIFAPAIEAANIGPCDFTDDDRKLLPNKRPIVNFRVGVCKRSLGVPLDLTLQNKIGGETTHLVGRGDDRDDKKRRAEQILKQSMENSRELIQL